MGNTPSQQSANKDLYDAYIQQQQDLIYQQQKQINDLYQFNLNSQQMPSNMFFEQQQSQTAQQQQNLNLNPFLSYFDYSYYPYSVLFVFCLILIGCFLVAFIQILQIQSQISSIVRAMTSRQVGHRGVLCQVSNWHS